MNRFMLVLLASMTVSLMAADFSIACPGLQPERIQIQATGALVTLPGDSTAAKKIPVQGFLRGEGSDILLDCSGNVVAQKFLDEQNAKPRAGNLPLRRIEVKGRFAFPVSVRRGPGAATHQIVVIYVESLKLVDEAPASYPAKAPRP